MRCPRCRARIIRDRGDAYCLACGEVGYAKHVGPDERIRRRGTRVEAPRSGAIWTEADEQYIAIHHAGLSARDIAEHLGRTPSGVLQYLAARQLKPRRRRTDPLEGEFLGEERIPTCNNSKSGT